MSCEFYLFEGLGKNSPDRVIVNLDSMRSAQLVNQQSFYVTLSRSREDAQVYTNDAHALRNAV
jgi:hypothetical protein